MGLDAGENLFVDEQGQWSGSYIPAIIRRYPFALVKATDADQYIVCVDEASALLNDSEGAALFDESGQPTQVIENVKRYLGELQQMDTFTRAFSKYVAEHNLFTPLNMRVRQREHTGNVPGCNAPQQGGLNHPSTDRCPTLPGHTTTPAA